MSLPTDLLDLILSFLQEDHAALRVCAESHPILSQLAERYSYAHVTVDENTIIMSEIQVGARFTVVLSTRPHIANYVRSLEVSISSPWRISFPQALPTVLSSLPCLTKIRLTSNGSIGWWSLPETFRTTLIGAFHLPSMKGISIMHMHSFPLSALNGCNGVKDLTLGGCKFNVNMTPNDVDRLLLESLSIKDCGREFLDRLITWAPTRNLRALELARFWYHSDYAKVPRLLSNSSNLLTFLSVDLGFSSASCSICRDFE